MGELSVNDLRRVATAANLRLALAAPPGGDVPDAFARLLARFSGVPDAGRPEAEARAGPRR